MADNTQLFEEILLELSYRSDEGYPDFSKPEHITILSEILTEWGMTDVKYELIKNLLKEDEEEDKKYFHKGKGVYVKIGDKDKEDAQTFKKDDSGKYSPVDKDEEESEEKSKTKISGADDFKHAPDIKKDKEKEKTKSEPTKSEKLKRVLEDTGTSTNPEIRIVSSEVLKEFNDDTDKSDKQKKEIREMLDASETLEGDFKERALVLTAIGQLYGTRENSGFMKNNLGLADRDQLVKNKQNFIIK